MLYYAIFTENNQNMNMVVYSQLSVSGMRGTDHYLVKVFEDIKRIRVQIGSQCVNDMMEM